MTKITPGYWYIKTDYSPFYTIVSVIEIVLGPHAGELGVWAFDKEGNDFVEDYGVGNFIAPVPAPEGINWRNFND